MASLRNFLPKPKQPQVLEYERPEPVSSALICTSFEPPPYGHRKGFIPRLDRDFGDGGAFPEITLVQYPLGMGKRDKKVSNALAVQLDSEGKVRFDAIARQGHGKDRIVHSNFKQLVPKEILDEDDPSMQRPGEEAIREQTEKTRLALERINGEKMSAAMPVKRAEQRAPAHYIRLTPSNQGQAFNSGAKQRVIKMMEMQKDPMEPPKFRTNKKIPGGPPSPPAPIIHSPNRKVSVKEQQDWKVPPCISNWKNAKGHTIPLDKRLAADGRGLQSVHINENFTKLSEALYIADRKAREAVEMRAHVEQNIAKKEKEAKERQLRSLAEESRKKRAGGMRNNEEDEEVNERNEIRRDRERDRVRKRNMERAGPQKKGGRPAGASGEERDISEKIALGLPSAGSRNTAETQFDQRLFNKTAGMDSGFQGGNDDGYNVYDQPWRRETKVGSSIYRPRNKEADSYGDEDIEKMKRSDRFVPEKPFSGTDNARERSGPVQFEKNEASEDVFDLDNFMAKAAKHGGSKRGHESRSDNRDDKSKRSRKRD